MKNPLDQVKEFHETFEHPILPEPQIPPNQRCDLRYNLLREELREFLEGIEHLDIVEIADALCDLQYVLSGAILEFGLQEKFPALFAEVHRSNMSKACSTLEEAQATLNKALADTGEEHHSVKRNGKYFIYRTRDMKTVKSINYSPANLKSILT